MVAVSVHLVSLSGPLAGLLLRCCLGRGSSSSLLGSVLVSTVLPGVDGSFGFLPVLPVLPVLTVLPVQPVRPMLLYSSEHTVPPKGRNEGVNKWVRGVQVY